MTTLVPSQSTEVLVEKNGTNSIGFIHHMALQCQKGR